MSIQDLPRCPNCGDYARSRHVCVPLPSPAMVDFRELRPLYELKVATGVDERPSWDSYFMAIAEAVSSRATCPRRAVGAVVVRDKRILSTGFNGSPPGHPHCTEEGCWIDEGNHCARVVHAEVNAAIQGARYGVSLDGAECYCTTLPCLGCAKVLVSAGIGRVVYASEYRPDARLSELQIEMEAFVG